MVLTRFHLYIGVDYPEDGLFAEESRRRRFSSDAAQVKELLADEQTEPRVLSGPVRSAALASEIRSAVGPERRDRDVLIYFAGHAEREGNDVFLVSADAEPGRLGIDLDWLLRLINETSHPRRIAVILDCCYSSCPGPLNRHRYWLAATGPDATSTDDFHDALVSCLAAADNRPGTLHGLHSCLVDKCVFSQPELSGTLSAPYDLKGRSERASTSARASWQAMASLSLARRGRLRTAFPTHLSFPELHEEGLYIEPKLYQLRPDNLPGAAKVPLDDVTARLAAGEALLVLGEPGSGKSFFSYLCQVDLLKKHTDALALDLGDVLRATREPPEPFGGRTGPDRLLAQLLSEGSWSGPGETGVLIFDSLDEAVSDDVDRGSVRKLFDQLAPKGRILAMCRRQEYENNLFSIIKSSNFNHIILIDNWNPLDEFPAYVALLAKHGYKGLESLQRLVEKQPELQRLVTRPLHARMLSFLWVQHGDEQTFDTPDSLAVLYRRYLDGFARVCAAKIGVGLQSADAPDFDTIRSLWRDFAWRVFSDGLLSGGSLVADAMSARTDSLTRSEQRAARAILQEHHSARGRIWSYLHYSFYEFLVAEAFALQLVAVYGRTDHQPAAVLFRRDMTKEVRRFAVRLLRRMPEARDPRFSDFLRHTYLAARATGSHNRDSLTSCNLIAYVLGRVKTAEAESIVRELLDEEKEPFLRTSLYWAACHLGDIEKFMEYYALLVSDKHMADLNRGYLMYYYGDWDRSQKPPYVDDDPKRPWANTWKKTLQMMAEDDYAVTSACRKLIDILTFLSFLEFRGEELSSEEGTALRVLIDSIRGIPMPDRYTADLMTRLLARTAEGLMR